MRRLERSQKRIGGWVTQRSAEDIRDTGFAILPHRQRGIEMACADGASPVEEGIEHAEPEHLRLSTGQECANQSRLPLRQCRIDRMPCGCGLLIALHPLNI